MPSVSLTYKPYAGIRTKFLCMLKNKFLPQRMLPYENVLERIQPMSNVHLPFVSVYQRMIDFVHTLAYASAIRNSVTGVLPDLFCLNFITCLCNEMLRQKYKRNCGVLGALYALYFASRANTCCHTAGADMFLLTRSRSTDRLYHVYN